MTYFHTFSGLQFLSLSSAMFWIQMSSFDVYFRLFFFGVNESNRRLVCYDGHRIFKFEITILRIALIRVVHYNSGPVFGLETTYIIITYADFKTLND